MSANTGAGAGQRGGNVITNGLKAINGVGEGIRGNINSFADQLGSGIQGNTNTGTSTHATDATSSKSNDQVAARGADQLKEGLEGLRRP